MHIAKLFFGERSLSKIAAVYDNEAAAQVAARQIRSLPHMQRRQVQIVRPFDREWGRRVEPEGLGIWRTAIRSHVTCAVIGFEVALLGFVGLWAADVTAVTSTPGMALLVMLMFGTIFGLMVGGLLTIRPDHEVVVARVREAIAHGQWSVVIHPASYRQRVEATRALGRTAMVSHSL